MCLWTAACASTPRSARDDRAGAYAVIVRWFVDHAGGDAAERRLVFVQPRDEGDGGGESEGEGVTIGLETQAALISGTIEFADVRFIDDRSEALDDDGVRDGGILLALGPGDPIGNRVTIVADEITSDSVAETRTFELVVRGGEWSLSAEPTSSP